jgi:hypothetical protein
VPIDRFGRGGVFLGYDYPDASLCYQYRVLQACGWLLWPVSCRLRALAWQRRDTLPGASDSGANDPRGAPGYPTGRRYWIVLPPTNWKSPAV